MFNSDFKTIFDNNIINGENIPSIAVVIWYNSPSFLLGCYFSNFRKYIPTIQADEKKIEINAGITYIIALNSILKCVHV